MIKVRNLVLCLALLASSPGLLCAKTASALGKDNDVRNALNEAQREAEQQSTHQKDTARAAARLAMESMRLASERVEAAAKLRQTEAIIADIAARIDAFTQRHREAELRVAIRLKAMQSLLPVIERLSLYPAETLLAAQTTTELALRGVVTLQGLAHQLEVETESMLRDQAQVDTAAAQLRQDAINLVEAESVQRQEADALDQAISTAHTQQEVAEAQANQAAVRAAAAAAKTENLRAALVALATERRIEDARVREGMARAEQQKRPVSAHSAHTLEKIAARPLASITPASGPSPQGQLQPPVVGVVVQGWGELGNGLASTGIAYLAPPGATVISPCGGRVVFAETFRSYGLLLIIDCGSGYHFVLSGLEKLNVKLGQNLLLGEPVGAMSSWTPGVGKHRPALHLELRHDGAPINPVPWLRSSG